MLGSLAAWRHVYKRCAEHCFPTERRGQSQRGGVATNPGNLSARGDPHEQCQR